MNGEKFPQGQNQDPADRQPETPVDPAENPTTGNEGDKEREINPGTDVERIKAVHDTVTKTVAAAGLRLEVIGEPLSQDGDTPS